MEGSLNFFVDFGYGVEEGRGGVLCFCKFYNRLSFGNSSTLYKSKK